MALAPVLMQPGLLALLGGLILLASFFYWLGFRARPRPAWAWHAQAGFLVTSLVLIPTVGLTLYLQRTAPARLRHLGVQPHPALSSSVGLAVGWARQLLSSFTAPAHRPLCSTSTARTGPTPAGL